MPRRRTAAQPIRPAVRPARGLGAPTGNGIGGAFLITSWGRAADRARMNIALVWVSIDVERLSARPREGEPADTNVSAGTNVPLVYGTVIVLLVVTFVSVLLVNSRTWYRPEAGTVKQVTVALVAPLEGAVFVPFR